MERAPCNARAASAIWRFSSLNQIFDNGASAGVISPLAALVATRLPRWRWMRALAAKGPMCDLDARGRGSRPPAAASRAGAPPRQRAAGTPPALPGPPDHVDGGDP